MGKSDTRSKLDRASRLLGLLRSDDHWTSAALARELRVSHRTLMRDLAHLKEAGYPIESDRGRGGGLRLVGRWGLDRLNLTNKEAVSLLMCLSLAEALTPSGNDLGARELKQKIAGVFPESQRKSINELRKRVLIGQPASDQVLKDFSHPSRQVWERLTFSFFERKRVAIEYQGESRQLTTRDFDPQFLLLNWPVWYALGWDYLRDDVRVLRLDRIRKIQALPLTIVSRPRSLFLQAFEQHFTSI